MDFPFHFVFEGMVKSMERTEQEYEIREKLIARIEGYTGTLRSVPYHEISTEDLETLLSVIMMTWK